MTASILLTDGLTKDYGRFRALDGLTLEVRPGEIVGLLGPNGSGKSTALRLFLGFLKATAGRCTIAGYDSWTQSVEVRTPRRVLAERAAPLRDHDGPPAHPLPGRPSR